jgi:hypothetical protein
VSEGPAEPPFPPPLQTFPVSSSSGAAFEIQGTSTTVQLTGIEANSAAAEGSFVINGQPADLILRQSRFETLEARVAVLEAALKSRPPGDARASPPPSIGHNHGLYIDENLNVDEASVRDLVALLKVQRATAPPVDLAKLVKAAKVADPTINKWQERIDMFVKGALFAAGKMATEEIAKQLEHASWVQSVFSALQSVYEALKDLFF